MKDIKADVTNWFVTRGIIITGISGFVLSLFIYLSYGSTYGSTYLGIGLTVFFTLTIFCVLVMLTCGLGIAKIVKNQITLWTIMVLSVFVTVEIYNLFIYQVFSYSYYDPLFVKEFFINRLTNFAVIASITSAVHFCNSHKLSHIFSE